MTIIEEIQETLKALRIAENHFNEAATPNQVGMAIFEYNEALERYEKALRKAKAERTTEYGPSRRLSG